MAVKRSQSASRVLSVLELIASRQPIGVSALAKLLDEDKSAVQRAVMTLADAGWIRVAPEPPTRWELTARIFTIAHLPYSGSDLRDRAGRILEELRDATSESVFLAIPDVRRFVVIAAVESEQMLRMAVRLGQVIPVRESATGRTVLPYLSREQQAAMLGEEPDAAILAEFAATRGRGYGLNAGDILPGSTNLAAPIFDAAGQPMAAIAISGPSERITAERHAQIGALLVEAARGLSRGSPHPAP
ncbi:IclR family transcriptional regulator [Phenylobacterium sp. LjRoot225]|uniref:IclR family transcriptional regulator n=1 Tax=Phenylobacterium sp. LjRoot225 TaxID=3342285 RepID=UPI003ECF46A3